MSIGGFMFCKHCGKLIDNDSAFCMYCGGSQNNNNRNDEPTQINPISKSRLFRRIHITKTSIADGIIFLCKKLIILLKELLVNALIIIVVCTPITILDFNRIRIPFDEEITGTILFLLIVGRYIYKLTKWVNRYKSKNS